MILLNYGLTINLLCEQGSPGKSLGKRIFWFFNGCPCDCSMIHRIIENPGWPSLQSKVVLITCCEIIIKCKVKEKYIIPFLYTIRKIEEKRGNLEMSKKER